MGELLAALVVTMVPVGHPCDVLAALDVVRSEAWSSGDIALLAGIYGPGAGAEDEARLRAWHERGITVQGMRMVHSACRRTGPTSVEVVERLGQAFAVLPDGDRRELPADSWNRHTIETQFVGRWVISRVS